MEYDIPKCFYYSPFLKSCFYWQEKLENAQEMLLMAENVESYFDDIELIIKSIHSYDTFVLMAVLIIRCSEKAKLWLENTLNSDDKQ